ncbi:hypothetical protein [Aeromonas sp. BIGb0445]|uniref:hypothetical protein n=1 Tax=Aeromonas sp. BIGb0445 TaxID=2940593 RepID=UPI002168A233|nr:hypothetical protein [Aeromonas sp. BIGb0445]MCS3459121.1 hypothetical protein [Aeromonas sp. BIGb0445]
MFIFFVICLDIAILVALASNPSYSAEVRWACVALVALFSLPPLLWLFASYGIELETKWQCRCRAKRRARAAAARLMNGR